MEKLLQTKNKAQEIAKGDTIEFTTGPFKGYKARVMRLDDVKGEITVELIDVVVPIPITTKIGTARVVSKMKEE